MEIRGNGLLLLIEADDFGLAVSSIGAGLGGLLVFELFGLLLGFPGGVVIDGADFAEGIGEGGAAGAAELHFGPGEAFLGGLLGEVFGEVVAAFLLGLLEFARGFLLAGEVVLLGDALSMLISSV